MSRAFRCPTHEVDCIPVVREDNQPVRAQVAWRCPTDDVTWPLRAQDRGRLIRVET